MKVGFVLVSPLVGASVGYRLGEWWLHRTVGPGAELETAVYPGMGAVIGGSLGLIFGIFIAWAWSRRNPR